MIYSEMYNEEIEELAKRVDMEFLRGSTLLISGGTGLIGSYLIDTLLSDQNFNINIYVLVRDVERAAARFEKYSGDNRLHLEKCDVTQDIGLEKQVDYVLHLASFSDPKNYARFPVETMLTNFIGCKNLLEYSKNHGCKRFFLASSCEVYGTSDLPMTEDNAGEVNPMDVRSCYNESKRASETLCKSFEKEYGLDVVIGRFCRIFGPTVLLNDTKVLSQFMNNAVNGEDIVLKSKGNQRFSYLYVSDAVAGLLLVLRNGTCGECYNISEDKDIMSLGEIAEYVSSLGGTKIVFERPNEKEKNAYSRAVNSVLISDKIKTLGFKPGLSLKQGIEKTVKYLKNNKNNK